MVTDGRENCLVGAVGERGTATSVHVNVDESRYERRHGGTCDRIEITGLNPADACTVHLQPAGLENG